MNANEICNMSSSHEDETTANKRYQRPRLRKKRRDVLNLSRKIQLSPDTLGHPRQNKQVHFKRSEKARPTKGKMIPKIIAQERLTKVFHGALSTTPHSRGHLIHKPKKSVTNHDLTCLLTAAKDGRLKESYVASKNFVLTPSPSRSASSEIDDVDETRPTDVSPKLSRRMIKGVHQKSASLDQNWNHRKQREGDSMNISKESEEIIHNLQENYLDFSPDTHIPLHSTELDLTKPSPITKVDREKVLYSFSMYHSFAVGTVESLYTEKENRYPSIHCLQDLQQELANIHSESENYKDLRKSKGDIIFNRSSEEDPKDSYENHTGLKAVTHTHVNTSVLKGQNYGDRVYHKNNQIYKELLGKNEDNNKYDIESQYVSRSTRIFKEESTKAWVSAIQSKLPVKSAEKEENCSYLNSCVNRDELLEAPRRKRVQEETNKDQSMVGMQHESEMGVQKKHCALDLFQRNRKVDKTLFQNVEEESFVLNNLNQPTGEMNHIKKSETWKQGLFSFRQNTRHNVQNTFTSLEKTNNRSSINLEKRAQPKEGKELQLPETTAWLPWFTRDDENEKTGTTSCLISSPRMPLINFSKAFEPMQHERGSEEFSPEHMIPRPPQKMHSMKVPTFLSELFPLSKAEVHSVEESFQISPQLSKQSGNHGSIFQRLIPKQEKPIKGKALITSEDIGGVIDCETRDLKKNLNSFRFYPRKLI